ncbi:MAG: tRNA pseudouridine(38-40) synthase TruA [SAR324 cluster bacterium]|nr:tRNA pseudouridine(38-40) synthase TruA [SAR324 cluster bacterium]
MCNWLLLLSYDGFNYHGWQVQKHHNTIEAELEKAIATITRKVASVFGAGRTDAKVHALNQTASFFSDANLSSEKWRAALNAVLPEDIVIKYVLKVSSDFHARHSSTAKFYRYLIYNKPYPNPFANHYSWWIRKPLDVTAMQQAAQYFIGEYDFSAFRSSQCSSLSPVKSVHKLIVYPLNTSIASLCIEIKANSFLQHMVRIIVGTLVAVGQHRFLPNSIPGIINSHDRTQSGKTAPPYGLYVLQVEYNNHDIQWPSDVLDF